ncbi:MAG: helix-turn-helix domain-containing protein [Clostridia bacterium]|nr:helix-turn-helix domain-containing protein [Clostridia bacterium]
MSRNQQQNTIAVDRIVAVNCFDLSPSFALPEDRHECWEFVYVDGGEVNCRTCGNDRILEQGDVIFHRPEKLHGTICNGKRSASIFNVIFDCRSADMDFFDETVIKVPQSLTPLLKKLIEECKSTYYISKFPLQIREDAPIGGERLTRLYIEEFLILLMRACRDEAVNAPAVSNGIKLNNGLVEEICAYLSENVYDRVTLKMLTERFHFGKSYLCEQFKHVKGVSVMNYYLELKLTEAKRLLREESLPIHEIAEQLGFESPEYFSRYFKKRVGHSPKAFRKMLINDSILKHRE